jgi:hypothetical protein
MDILSEVLGPGTMDRLYQLFVLYVYQENEENETSLLGIGPPYEKLLVLLFVT